MTVCDSSPASACTAAMVMSARAGEDVLEAEQRVVGDVEAEHLALELEQDLLVPLAVGHPHREDVVDAAGLLAQASPNRSNWPIASARLVSSTASTAAS